VEAAEVNETDPTAVDGEIVGLPAVLLRLASDAIEVQKIFDRVYAEELDRAEARCSMYRTLHELLRGSGDALLPCRVLLDTHEAECSIVIRSTRGSAVRAEIVNAGCAARYERLRERSSRIVLRIEQVPAPDLRDATSSV
jgi:hypothetical protein